jgi:hypothetical protein
MFIMRKLLSCILFSIILSVTTFANYQTPGTGVTYSLSELLVNAGPDMSFISGQYFVNDSITISSNDTLNILSDEIVKFAGNTLLQINGVLNINPPTGVLFTAQDQAVGFLGLRLDFSNGSNIRKLTFEYASALRIADCSPALTDCIIRYNTTSSTLGSSAITLFRANPVINNCQFIQNRRAAIGGGANIPNAPKINGSVFSANNTQNLNVPQINLGASGPDTTKIMNCQIIGGNTNSGGIGFLPLGELHVLINNNYIKGNRYGINMQGGSDINSIISYNRIEDNNIQNNANLGGSGIAFAGGSAASQQNSIVTGNIFSNNLWGITIQNRSKPNLGNLNNADTTDDGRNSFINNTNATTPGIDLYNNSIDPIFAMGNYWNTNVESLIENKIFHQPDNASLGLVTYSSFLLPVNLLTFTARPNGNDVLLNWQTSAETNSHNFEVERSFDGLNFIPVRKVAAAGNSNITILYSVSDISAGKSGRNLFYRLKLTDRDGAISYSAVVLVTFARAEQIQVVRSYPTILHKGKVFTVEMTGTRNEKLNIQYYDASGRMLATKAINIIKGYNKLELALPAKATSGIINIKLFAEGFVNAISIITL